ncbi:hypothetical protein [Phascolarctobacterium succinatutens]|uniref:hypothetical protein n=1 Tax=Phascolarctobacterium succinatutens TaxID=626940 RepID=UPI003FD7A777
MSKNAEAYMIHKKYLKKASKSLEISRIISLKRAGEIAAKERSGLCNIQEVV